MTRRVKKAIATRHLRTGIQVLLLWLAICVWVSLPPFAVVIGIGLISIEIVANAKRSGNFAFALQENIWSMALLVIVMLTKIFYEVLKKVYL